jgi:hypothetical protein
MLTRLLFVCLNCSKPEACVHNILKLLPPKKTLVVSITKVTWLMLLKEMIAVYSETHKKPTNTLCGQTAEFRNVKAGLFCMGMKLDLSH